MRAWLLERGPSWRRAILLIVVAGVPLVVHRGLYDPPNVPKLSLLFLGVSVVAALRIAEGFQGAGWSSLRRLMVPALAMSVPLLVAWIASPYKEWSLFGFHSRFQGLVPYLAVIALGVLIADAFAGHAHQIVWALAIAAGAVGGYALVQAVDLDPYEWVLFGDVTGTATSTLGNPNFVGGFLGTVLPVFVVLWLLFSKRRIVVTLLGVLAAGGWIVAVSEGGWAAGLAGLTVTGAFLLARRWPKAVLAGLGAVVLIAATMIGVVVYSAANPEADVFSRTGELRGYWWEASARMGADSPLVGLGPNAFAVEGVQYRPIEEALINTFAFSDDPHSVPLQLFAATGALGLAGYLLTAGWALKTAVSLDRSNLIGVALAGCVVGYLVQSLVSIDELSLRVALWSILGGLAAASAEGTREQTVAAHKRARRHPRRRPAREPLKAAPALIAIAVATLAAGWWTVNFVIADARVKHGLDLFASGFPGEAMQEFELALDFRDDYTYRRQYGARLGQAALAQEETGRPFLEEMRQTYSYLEDFPDMAGLVISGRVLHRWAEVDEGALEEALSFYRRALALDPRNPLLRQETADILLLMDRHEEALEVLAPAVDYVPTLSDPEFAPYADQFAPYWGALALARAEVGDEQGARDAIEIAVSLVPDEPRAGAARQVLAEE